MSLLLSLFSFAPGAVAQGNEEELRTQAEALFSEEKYKEAFKLYSQLLSLNLQSPEYNYRFGACQLFTVADKEEALKYLQFAASAETPPALAYFYYGLGLHLNYRFDKAIAQYEKYKPLANKKDPELALVDHYIAQCKNGKTLVSSFTDINVIQREVLPRTDFYRNYDLSEFGGKIIVKPEDYMSEEDKRRDAIFLMYFQPGSDFLFYASYSEKNATGKDLFSAQKLPTGEWGTPARLSDVVNTSFDEDYPFIHPEGNVLYFASKGHNSMGGYDIFKSTRKGDGSWTQPINLEFAINTPWDDFLFITDLEEKKAWFASNRETSSDMVTVYRIGIDRVPLDLTLIQGTFEVEGSRKAKITVHDQIQNKVIGVYESDRQFGKYVLDLRGSGKYKFIVEAEESNAVHEGLVEIPREKGLKQFTQVMRLTNDNGREKLQIINNLEEQPSESLLTAEILKRQASLNVNTSEDAIDRTTEILDAGSASTSSDAKTPGEMMEAARLEVKELTGDAKLLNQKAAMLYERAQQKGGSSKPEDLAEAALAAELAASYKEEADLREVAAANMQKTLSNLESGSLEEAAFQAQYNQLHTTAQNFKPLEDFEAGLKTDMEKRALPTEKLYDDKASELAQFQSDLKAMDDEIAYYEREIAQTKDDAMKEELGYQLEETRKAKPEKEASIRRVTAELAEAERQKDLAATYLGVTAALLTEAEEKAATYASAVSAGAINQINTSLQTRAAADPALTALVAPQKAAEAMNESLAASRANAGTSDSPEASTPADSGNPASESTSETGSGSATGSAAESATTAGTASETATGGETTDVSGNTATNETQTSDNAGNTASNTPATTTAGTSDASQDPATAANNPTAEPTPGATGTTGDVNEAIRTIQATPAQPDIVGGDYNAVLANRIAEATNAEDPFIAETRKAELYDQWAENIQYRIDSLEAVQDASTDPEVKVALANEIASLNEAKDEKEDLAMKSYASLAALNDAQDESWSVNASGNETSSTNVGVGEVVGEDVGEETAGSEPTGTPAITVAPPITEELLSAGPLPPSTVAVNTKFEGLIAAIPANLDPVSRQEEEALFTKQWMEALKVELDVISAQISASTDPEVRANLEEKSYAINEQYINKKNEHNAMQQTLSASLRKESLDRAAADLQKQLAPYIESYDERVFLQLEEQINILPDENQRIVQTTTLNRNWIVAISNEELKTEARLANTADPNLQKSLEQRLVTLAAKKQEVIAQMDAADNVPGGPTAPPTVIVKGSEKYEGYQPVETAKTEDYTALSTTRATEQQQAATKVSELESKLAATKKKKDREPIEAELAKARESQLVAQTEAAAYESSAASIASVEPQLLHISAGDPLPSQVQMEKAQALETAAQTLTSEAATARSAVASASKKTRPDAERSAAEKERIALAKRTEAQIALNLAKEMAEIEQRAIETNFLILPGEEAVLPVVSRSLNPTEQADVAATSEYESYRQDMEKVRALRQQAAELKTQETTLSAEAQDYMRYSSSGIGPDGQAANRVAMSNEAFARYERADSLSAVAARLNRQAAFLENEANKSLLKNPAEVYMNILAYEATQEATTSEPIASGGETASPATPGTTVPGSEPASNAGTGSTSEPAVATDTSASDPFGLTPPTEGSRTVDVPEDVLTNTIFDEAGSPPPATNNASRVNTASNSNAPVVTSAGASIYSDRNPIPLDPPMPSGIVYKVQIGAFRNPIQQDAFPGIQPITGESAGNGLTRYSAGQFTGFDDADAAKARIQQLGYPDAFVVAYLNGVRIPVSQARAGATATGGTPRPAPTGQLPSNSLVKQGPLQVQDIQNKSGVLLTVQVGVFRRPVRASDVYNLTPLFQENMPNGTYRYTTGIFTDVQTATRARDEIRQMGIPDAFVTAYRDGRRITVEEARQALAAGGATTPTNATPGASTGATTQATHQILLGTYSGEVPVQEASVILSLSGQGVKKVKNSDGTNSYYLGSFNSLGEASAEAERLRNMGLTQAQPKAL